MVFHLLQHSILELISKSELMGGGGKSNKLINNQPNFLLLLLISLFFLLIKGYIVYLAYNIVIPKIMYSISTKKMLGDIENNFHPLSYMDSILFVILMNTLFHS
jgi:hypothetical protein